MWDDILNMTAMLFIQGHGEEQKNIELMFNLLRERIEDYDTIVTVAKSWDTFEDLKQAKIALNYAGIFHASRFIILMDYLNLKHKKGEL